MKGFRVLLLLVLSVGAMSVSMPGVSSQPQRAFAGGDDGDDDDGDDDDDDGEEGSSGRIGDFTFGSGSAEFGFPLQSHFEFSAASGPNGENATGFARATNVLGTEYAGPVTCLSVSGNRAAFEVDSNNPDVVFFVGDNGAAGAGDEFNFHFLPEGADTICPDPNSRPSEQSVVAGDIVVGDNQPLPGSGDGDDDDDEDND